MAFFVVRQFSSKKGSWRIFILREFFFATIIGLYDGKPFFSPICHSRSVCRIFFASSRRRLAKTTYVVEQMNIKQLFFSFFWNIKQVSYLMLCFFISSLSAEDVLLSTPELFGLNRLSAAFGISSWLVERFSRAASSCCAPSLWCMQIWKFWMDKIWIFGFYMIFHFEKLQTTVKLKVSMFAQLIVRQNTTSTSNKNRVLPAIGPFRGGSISTRIFRGIFLIYRFLNEQILLFKSVLNNPICWWVLFLLETVTKKI